MWPAVAGARRSLSAAAAAILNPSNPFAAMSAKQKARAALELLKSAPASDPDAIIAICHVAELSPSASPVDRLALSCASQKLADSPAALRRLFAPFAAHDAISILGHAKLLDDALAIFRAAPSTRALNSLLLACLLAGRPGEAARLFDDLPAAHGVKPDIDSYNTLIKSLAEAETPRLFFSALQDMLLLGVKPNATTFINALYGFYKSNRLDDVDKVLALMGKHGCKHTLPVYNIRIQGLCMLRQSSDAKSLLKNMVKNGLTPNWVTYSHLIHGFCKEGNLDEAKRLYDEMRKKGLVGNSNFYFTFIYHLCQGGDFMTGLSLCRQTMARNWIPGFSTMKMLVNGLAGSGMVEEAKEIIETMKGRFAGSADTWKEVEEALPQ